MTTPLVLLHGFLGAPSAWDLVLRFVEPTFPTHALALPGHGPRPWVPGMSEVPAGERSLRGRAACASWDEAIDAFAERLPSRAHVVGYSMGARVALGVAARHPSRIASMVLVGLDPGLVDDTERRARRAWEEELARDLEHGDLARFVDAWEALPIFATQRALPADVRARRRDERLAHVPSALAWAQRTLGLGAMPALLDALATFDGPTHLVTGARDQKFTALAQRALARVPACVHTALGGVGHDVGLEAPRALASIVRSMHQGAIA